MRCLLAAVALALCAPATASADVFSSTRKPPRPTHGDVISAKVIRGTAALSGQGRDALVRYRSVGVNGRLVTVSGVVSVPRGTAPRGGWPVITYAHGTTGIADSCAPSRGLASPSNAYASPLLRRWLKRGWAVVRTDYEGLGTPGVHPYLIGTSEGRATLDMVRAARGVTIAPIDARRVLISGHSQGGHAALWAASLAPRYTPELRIRGTVAFAPASHLAEQGQIIPKLGITALSGLISLIVRGLDVQKPSLHVSSYLTARARALYPQTLTRCLSDLSRPDSFGGLAANQIFRADRDLTPVLAQLGRNDPEDLRIPTPVRVEQGEADTTVFPTYTDELVQEYRGRRIRVTYVRYPGFGHGDVITREASQADATSYIAAHFRG